MYIFYLFKIFRNILTIQTKAHTAVTLNPLAPGTHWTWASLVLHNAWCCSGTVLTRAGVANALLTNFQFPMGWFIGTTFTWDVEDHLCYV